MPNRNFSELKSCLVAIGKIIVLTMAAFENQSGGKTISLLSKEGECFEIPREVCQLSNLLAGMLQEDDDADEVQELPLPNVSAPILSKIVDFMLAFHQEPMRKLNKVCSQNTTLYHTQNFVPFLLCVDHNNKNSNTYYSTQYTCLVFTYSVHVVSHWSLSI